MRVSKHAAWAVLAAVALGSAGCAGQGPNSASCEPLAGTFTTALADDRGVLSAKVWVPVVSARGDYLSWLEALDVASRSLTTSELEAIMAASGAEQDAAVLAAVSDIPEAVTPAPKKGKTQPAPDALDYHLLVPSSPVGAAVNRFYVAALERQGQVVDSKTLGTADAVSAVARNEPGQVALLELPDLAGTLGALLPSTGTTGQVHATSIVAAERGLALGSPTAANRTPQVLVTDEFARSHEGLTDLSGLARVCPGLAVAATDAAVASLAPLTAAYGLRAEPADQEAVDRVRAGQIVAALAPATHHSG